MELLNFIADIGIAIFLALASWVGIFYIIALSLQWAKDALDRTSRDYYAVYDEALAERRRIKAADDQEAWEVD